MNRPNEAERVPPLPQGVILAIGLGVIAVFIAVLVVGMSRSTYDVWVGILAAPVLMAISAPILARQARREGSPRLWWFLLGMLALHLVLAGVGYYMLTNVYSGGDANYYLRLAGPLGEQFRRGDFAIDLKGGILGLNWAGVVAGVSYAIAGPSKLAAFLFFSWLGFWGVYLFYLAFRLAVPEGRLSSYRHLVFLLPSLAYWSSFLGKDAWMVFGLGIAAYGVARILVGPLWRGLLPFVLGCLCMSAIRPHIAGMIGLALAFGFVLRPPKTELRELAPIAKGVGLLVVGALAIVLLLRTEAYLQSRGYETEAGLTAALDKTSRGGDYGGSRYEPPIVSNPVRLPVAAVTVLYRPFPFEAGSATEILVSAQMVFLGVLTVARWRWVVAAVLSVRRQPYVAFCIAYVTMIVIAFSSFGNFGLLDRERAQLWPLFLVLLAVPPPEPAPPPASDRSGEEVAADDDDRARVHG